MPTASSSRMALSMNGMPSLFEENSSARVTGRGGRESRNAASPLAASDKPGSAVSTHNAGSRIGACVRGIPSALSLAGSRLSEPSRPVNRLPLPGREMQNILHMYSRQQEPGNKLPVNWRRAQKEKRLTAGR
jgi:hypothetical protein